MTRTPTSPDEPAIAPFPIPAATRKVLLFGGTFDPVHRGHIGAAAAARDLTIGPDGWLVFVPAARSPFKHETPGAGDAERLEMLHLALRSVPNTAVWIDELQRPAPSYWIETIRRARTILGPAADLRFLIGADAAIAFRRWRDWQAILDIAEPVVMARPPLLTAPQFQAAIATERAWTAADLARWRSRFVEGALIDISATDVREALESEDPRAAQWLDPAVLEFIRLRGLYRRNPPQGPSSPEGGGAAPTPPRP